MDAHQSLCLALIFVSFTTVATTNSVNGSKIILQLIHKNSILSPFYNHPKVFSRFLPDDDDIVAPIIPGDYGSYFLVNISIGEPPIPQFLQMDTGSSLTWVQNTTLNVAYNSNASSTYNEFPCNSTLSRCANYSSDSFCHISEHKCGYLISYADGSSSAGVLGTEMFTFVTSTDGIASIHNLAFGRAINTHRMDQLSGILGLGNGNGSLVSRVSNQFSYCIGNISDPYYIQSKLILGEGAIFEGDTTPMLIYGGHYYVKLEGIHVGDTPLKIVEEELACNVMIDSGTTLTLLRRKVFDLLKEEVMNLMNDMMESVEARCERLCYKGNIVRDVKGFPVVTLHFANNGADLYMDAEGMFIIDEGDTFCMAVDVAGEDGNIVGAYAQQHFNVGFDLNKNVVTFQRTQCELLDD